jgi:hypothetical protein
MQILSRSSRKFGFVLGIIYDSACGVKWQELLAEALTGSFVSISPCRIFSLVLYNC